MRAEVPRLEFVHAPLQPDLQAAFCAAVAADAGGGFAARRLVVVPSHAVGAHLVRVLARRGGAAGALRPLGWSELALALTAPERASARRALLSREAPAWLLRRLRERATRPPNYFDSLLDMRGFRVALQRSFADLARAGLASRREVERLLVRHGATLPLELRHALELYLAYRTGFESTHDDAAGVLWQAARLPPGRFTGALATETLWIYGFDALSALEARLLERLAGDPDVRMAAYVPEAAPPDARLVALLERLGFAPRGPGPRRAASLPADLHVVSAPSDEAEADEVARRLLAAAEGGIPFRDMAVVARSPRRLELLRAVLERYGIPCASAAGPSLQSCRAGRALLYGLDLLEHGLSPEPVLAFAHVAPLRWRHWAGMPDDPVPSSWERVAHEAFLGVGLDDWTAKLRRLRADLERRAAELEADGEPAQRPRAVARAASELLQLGRALQRDLARFPERGAWSDFVAAAQAVLTGAFEPGPEVEALHAALARLRSLDGLGAGRVQREDFRDALRHLLAETPLQAGSFLDRDGVRLGTAAELAGLDFEVVCVTGLQEGEWPAAPQEDPVLLDRGRRLLGELLGDPQALPPSSRLAERDRRLFWAAAGAARRRLILSWARLDPSTGATRLPSTLLLELAARREGREVDFGALATLPWVERVPLRRTAVPVDLPVLDAAEYDFLTVSALPPRAARRYIGRLGGIPARGLRLEVLRHQRRRFTVVDGALRRSDVRQALVERFRAQPYSATQLASYATCPFRFFARHVLRIEPLDREEHREPTDLEIGKLVHRILEHFYAGLERDGRLRLETTSFESLRRRLLEAADEVFRAAEARGQTGAGLLWSIRKQRLREDLGRFLCYERQRSGTWVPEGFERRFGRGAGLVPSVERAGAPGLDLVGCIDRIDRHPQHDGVRVVDYKSGRLPGSGLESPHALQLLVYLYAATGGSTERLARSEARFLFVTRRGGFGLQRLPGRVLVERRGEFTGLLGGVARGIEAGEFFPQPGPGAARCGACDYETLCDVGIAAQSEAKAGAGQTRAFLALPDFGSALETVPLATPAAPGGEAP
jgi:RecB family exonuclease